ncbi:hypothetical protein LEP1GSC086_0140, partial [Leptospira weilii str. LNT 1234]
ILLQRILKTFILLSKKSSCKVLFGPVFSKEQIGTWTGSYENGFFCCRILQRIVESINERNSGTFSHTTIG